MLWWLVDHGTVVYLVLGLTVLVLVAMYWSSRRSKFLVACGVVLALLGLYFALTRVVVTDRKQLFLNVLAMARGVEEGGAEKVLQHFSREFSLQGMNMAAFRERGTAIIRSRRVSQIHVSNFDYEKLSRENRQAQVSFFVSFALDGDSRIMKRCRLEFVLEGENWRLKSFQLFSVGSDQPMAIPI